MPPQKSSLATKLKWSDSGTHCSSQVNEDVIYSLRHWNFIRSLCSKKDKTNSEFSDRIHFRWNCTHSDRQKDRCTDTQWVRTCGSRWRGVGPQIRGPFPSPAFSIKPLHTGNNLWTWPSNSPAPILSPESQPLPPPNYIKQTPSTPWPPDPQHIPHLDKTNPTLRMQNYIYIMYLLQQAEMNTHTHTHTRVPCVHIEGSVVIL